MTDIEDIAKTMINNDYKTFEEFNTDFLKTTRRFKSAINKSDLYNFCIENYSSGIENIKKFCVKRSSRSHSGVCVISTIMAPEWYHSDGSRRKFTCKYDCSFCPNDPTQARSYPRSEPVPMRGTQNEFDVVRQAHSRMCTLERNHHTVDKLEWLVLGGTWSSFPKKYREFYHCSIIFAANLWAEGINVCEIQRELGYKLNVYFHDGSVINDDRPPSDEWRKYVREMKSIEEEIEINRNNGKCRVIGITIETRPDEIKKSELEFMRKLAVTRIQMGFQHTNNEVLKKNKRGCSIERCKKGLRLALINGFKVDGHWMPDLPGSNLEMDREMLTLALTDENLRCDQVKIYPCQVLEFTAMKKWYDSGDYTPYGESNFEGLKELIIYAKSIMPPWVRTNRIVRDFPKNIIKGGLTVTHLNDVVLRTMKERGIVCSCIRCREVKRAVVNHDKAELCVDEYKSCGGKEFFISFKIENVLLGFCRLRLNGVVSEKEQLDILKDCALIRELHVYGCTTNKGVNVQHRGYGSRLIEKAESIAIENGYGKIAVISGAGVQNYYSSKGFEDGLFMVKKLM